MHENRNLFLFLIEINNMHCTRHMLPIPRTCIWRRCGVSWRRRLGRWCSIYRHRALYKKNICLRLNLGGREPSSVRRRLAGRWASLLDRDTGPSLFSQTVTTAVSIRHVNINNRVQQKPSIIWTHATYLILGVA